eukprot:5920646-Amphidinium_carterae.1
MSPLVFPIVQQWLDQQVVARVKAQRLHHRKRHNSVICCAKLPWSGRRVLCLANTLPKYISHTSKHAVP